MLSEAEKATKWTVLRPTELKSEAATILALRSDGSILASEEPPLNDIYTMTSQAEMRRFAALRLEALPEANIQGSGPGWGVGNFHLTEIRAVLRRTGKTTSP